MYATKLRGEITRDRQLVVELPRELEPGAVEVILLQPSSSRPTTRRARRNAAHPAFGMWAKRTDITDSASFATELRRRVETREDGNAPD